MSRPDRSALFWGTLLVLLGVTFLLNNFHLGPKNLLQWWPVVVLGAGILLFGRGLILRQGGALITGTILAFLGGFWFLDSLGRMDERLFAPILLIAFGVGLLFRSLLATSP